MRPSPAPAGSLPSSAQRRRPRPRRVPQAPLGRTRSHCTTTADRGPNEPGRVRTTGGQGGARINTARADPVAGPSCRRPLQTETEFSADSREGQTPSQSTSRRGSRQAQAEPGDPRGSQDQRPCGDGPGREGAPVPAGTRPRAGPRHRSGSHPGIRDPQRALARRGRNEARGLLNPPALRRKELCGHGGRPPFDFCWKTVKFLVKQTPPQRMHAMRVHTARPLRADRAAPRPPVSPRLSATRLSTRSARTLCRARSLPWGRPVPTSLGRPAGSSGTGGGGRTASGWRGPRAVTMAAPSPRKGARLM